MKTDPSLEQKLKKLFSSQKLGVLATQQKKKPYTSLVAFACSDDILAWEASQELVYNIPLKAGDIVFFNEATGTQKIGTHTGNDLTINALGGATFVCDGTIWWQVAGQGD